MHSLRAQLEVLKDIKSITSYIDRLCHFIYLMLKLSFDYLACTAPLLLVDLPSQPGYTPNNDDNPLLLNIITQSPVAFQSSSSSSLTSKPPHPTRKRRWDRLNKVPACNKKRNISKDSIEYSNISWKEVKDVLATTSYIQGKKEFPEDSLDFLYKYISAVTVSFGSFITAKRLHFIAPVVICVSYLFNGDVQITADEDLEGSLVRAHAHFEFVLRRHNKCVCIVEAKKRRHGAGYGTRLGKL
jgi:hypothetical protein